MAGLGQILNRVFFWSYDRGTWQYDAAVILILIFVLATPTRWFHDQPQVGLPVNSTQVELLSKSGETETYKVDARVLAPPNAPPRFRMICTPPFKKPGWGSAMGDSLSAGLSPFGTRLER